MYKYSKDYSFSITLKNFITESEGITKSSPQSYIYKNNNYLASLLEKKYTIAPFEKSDINFEKFKFFNKKRIIFLNKNLQEILYLIEVSERFKSFKKSKNKRTNKIYNKIETNINLNYLNLKLIKIKNLFDIINTFKDFIKKVLILNFYFQSQFLIKTDTILENEEYSRNFEGNFYNFFVITNKYDLKKWSLNDYNNYFLQHMSFNIFYPKVIIFKEKIPFFFKNKIYNLFDFLVFSKLKFKINTLKVGVNFFNKFYQIFKIHYLEKKIKKRIKKVFFAKIKNKQFKRRSYSKFFQFKKVVNFKKLNKFMAKLLLIKKKYFKKNLYKNFYIKNNFFFKIILNKKILKKKFKIYLKKRTKRREIIKIKNFCNYNKFLKLNYLIRQKKCFKWVYKYSNKYNLINYFKKKFILLHKRTLVITLKENYNKVIPKFLYVLNPNLNKNLNILQKFKLIYKVKKIIILKIINYFNCLMYKINNFYFKTLLFKTKFNIKKNKLKKNKFYLKLKKLIFYKFYKIIQKNFIKLCIHVLIKFKIIFKKYNLFNFKNYRKIKNFIKYILKIRNKQKKNKFIVQFTRKLIK